MNRSVFCVGFAVAACCASPAMAVPASQMQAEKLGHGLKAYFGKAPGVVTVKPDGEHYIVTVDVMATINKAVIKRLALKASPITFTLEPKGEGKWLTQLDTPVSFSTLNPGVLDAHVSAKALKVHAVFDEALGWFSEGDVDVQGLDIFQLASQPGKPDTSIHYYMQGVTLKSKAISSGDQVVDVTFSHDVKGWEETMVLPAPSGDQTMAVKLMASAAQSTGSLKGLKIGALKQVLSYVVLRGQKPVSKAEEPKIRALGQAVLPLMTNFEGAGELTDVSVDTPTGIFRSTQAHFALDTNGLMAPGLFHETIRFSGIEIPANVRAGLPEYARDLVPDSGTLDVKAEGFDLGAVAKLMIAEAPITADEAGKPVPQERFNKAFLPKGTLKLSSDGMRLTSKVYDITVAGGMSVGAVMEPNGTGKITVTGMDQIIASLKKAPMTPQSEKTLGFLALLKGLGKPQGQALYWDVVVPLGGGITVNGVNMDKLGGAAKPAL